MFKVGKCIPLFIHSFILYLLFYWSIVDLQCCVSFKCTAKWFSYTYVYIHIYVYIYAFIEHLFGTNSALKEPEERLKFFRLWRSPESGRREDDLNHSLWLTEKRIPGVLPGLRKCTWIKSEGISQGKWDHRILISASSLHCFLRNPSPWWVRDLAFWLVQTLVSFWKRFPPLPCKQDNIMNTGSA